MPFEFTEEEIEQLALSDEQKTKILDKVTGYEADLKKTYDGKAHENAQGILDGAASKITEVTGIEREQGEKIADFIQRANTAHSKQLREDLEKAKNDYLEKSKNVKGSEGLSEELAALKAKYDDAQQKLANFDDLNDKASKYEELQTKYTNMTEQVAFTNVKPAFPDTVNKYEAQAKWEAFIKGVKEKYNVKLVDGQGLAIDKENEYKQKSIEDLLKEDAEIQSLLGGRQQGGTGAKAVDLTKIEGVPFEVPKEASKADVQKLIQEHLEKEGVNKTSADYSQKFSELYKKIKSPQKG